MAQNPGPVDQRMVHRKLDKQGVGWVGTLLGLLPKRAFGLFSWSGSNAIVTILLKLLWLCVVLVVFYFVFTWWNRVNEKHQDTQGVEEDEEDEFEEEYNDPM